MVTECGTGKLYVIGSTAPEVLNPDGLTALYPWGKSIWSLYELVSGTSPVDGKHHALRHMTNNTREMYSRECDPRASGTAFAGPNGELALYWRRAPARGPPLPTLGPRQLRVTLNLRWRASSMSGAHR